LSNSFASDNSLLGPYRQTPIRLFIADRALLKQVAASLSKLGFVMVTVAKVEPNYFQSMKQLFADLRQADGVVLVNHPRKKVEDSTGRQYEDYCFHDYYSGLASLVTNTNKEVSEVVGKCVPIFSMAQDADMRGRIITELFEFGILSAFMLSVQDLRASAAEQVESLAGELQGYLQDYFMQREQRTRELKEYKSAEDLKQRREEAEKIMAQVEQLKLAKDYDKAIALCRQAMEVLPTNAAAYLEGGRLLIKKKRYPPALQMFRDAEQVAMALPGPNEEIGNLRLTQVKEHLEDCKHRGVPPDQGMVARLLGEAVSNYGKAMEKARTIQLVRPQDQDAKRAEVLTGIADDILSMDLEQVVDENSPILRELGKLVKNVLGAKGKGAQELAGRHLLSLGMGALYENDFQTAQDYFLRAAGQPEFRDQANIKLNNLGTQLRQRGRSDEAIAVYQKLLELKPAFAGVVLYNLAVAFQNKSRQMTDSNPGKAEQLEREAAGTVVQAIYVDPSLPLEENFYLNPVMAPPLGRLQGYFREATQGADRQSQDPSRQACLKSVEHLERLLARRQQREALQFLFELTHKLKPFFLNFDQYASRPVYQFAQSLQAVLGNHPDPKMQTFGKVLGVLVTRGQKALAEETSTGQPQLDLALQALMRADQAQAARAMATAFYQSPELTGHQGLAANKTLQNLCREIQRKLAGVDLARFPAV
jgi:tetratricopeptide (TPR) repeat protein